MASITINTNFASLTAQRNLSKATTSMNVAMERLTTGYRINSGKDDAAGAAVSNLMEAQITAYDVAVSNTTMGLSLLDTAEGVLDIILYGTGGEKLKLTYDRMYAKGVKFARFEGVINNLERRYNETNSEEFGGRTMEKIASFTIDHIKLQPGVYVSRKDRIGA